MHHRTQITMETHILWIIAEHITMETDTHHMDHRPPWKQTHHMDHHRSPWKQTDIMDHHRPPWKQTLWITDHHGNRHTPYGSSQITMETDTHHMDHHGTLIIIRTGVHLEHIITMKLTWWMIMGPTDILTWSTADHHHQGLIELQRVGGHTLLSPVAP